MKTYKSKSILEKDRAGFHSNLLRPNKNLSRNKSAFLLKFNGKTRKALRKIKIAGKARNKSSVKNCGSSNSKSRGEEAGGSRNLGLAKTQIFPANSRSNLLKNMVVHDKYKVVRLLGEGCYSRVYLVKHLLSGSFFALKSIKLESLSTSDKFMNLEVMEATRARAARESAGI